MFKNKIVFITGASSGFGAACAKYFARAGASLVLCARRLDAVNQVADDLKKEFHNNIYTFALDVRDYDSVQKNIAAIPESFSKIDVLINNAGLAAGLDFIQEADPKDWDVMIDTNIKGLLYVTRQILPGMIARNSGHIINIGSISSYNVYAKGVVYCATKFAVRALSEGLRHDVFGKRIRVTAIYPGSAETNFSNVRLKEDKARAKKIYEGYTPLSADDVADAVFYAASRPPHVDVTDLTLFPAAQVSVSMVHRE